MVAEKISLHYDIKIKAAFRRLSCALGGT